MEFRQHFRLTQPGMRCLIIVGIIKLAFFALDPLPQFFQGDSNAYLYTALASWIPHDRSFVYGFMIQGLTYLGNNLTPLVVAQCLASLGTCLLVFHITRTYFGLSANLATAAACCCALDPMQLYYERAVMTEAFSLFAFALCVTVALRYVARPRVATLVVLAFLCMLPISLRMTFVLPSIAICLLPPLYLVITQRYGQASRWPTTGQNLVRSIWSSTTARYFGHFAVVSVSIFALNYGYCCLHGKRSYPRYVHDEGLFRLAGLLPIITPADATDPRVAAVLASSNEAELKNRDLFAVNLFNVGTFGRNMRLAIPDPDELSRVSAATARNILRRAPFQVAMLGWSTWLDYFSYAKMEARVIEDEGGNVAFVPGQLAFIRESFLPELTRDWGERPTLVKGLHFHLRGFYYFLMLTPLYGLAAAWYGWKKNPAAILIFLVSIVGLIGTACVFAYPVIRYLHPFGFVAPIVFAVVVDCALARRAERTKTSSNSAGRSPMRPHFPLLGKLTRRAG